MNFLEKIQSLPEKKKKAILWVLVIFFGAIFLFLWIEMTKKNLSEFKREEIMEGINFPQLEEDVFKGIDSQVEELKDYNLEQNEEESKTK